MAHNRKRLAGFITGIVSRVHLDTPLVYLKGVGPYRAEMLEAKGLVFAGMSPDGLLPETVEFPDHPWFIGVQYHPELKSRPFEPHPLFASFIAAAKEQSRLV